MSTHPLLIVEPRRSLVIRDMVLTVLAWLLFVYLFWRGVIFTLENEPTIGPRPLAAVFFHDLTLISFYVLVCLFNAALLILWAKYNQFRGRVEKRRRRDDLSPDEISRSFHVPLETLSMLPVFQVVTIHNDSRGGFAFAEVGNRLGCAAGPDGSVQADAGPLFSAGASAMAGDGAVAGAVPPGGMASVLSTHDSGSDEPGAVAQAQGVVRPLDPIILDARRPAPAAVSGAPSSPEPVPDSPTFAPGGEGGMGPVVSPASLGTGPFADPRVVSPGGEEMTGPLVSSTGAEPFSDPPPPPTGAEHLTASVCTGEPNIPHPGPSAGGPATPGFEHLSVSGFFVGGPLGFYPLGPSDVEDPAAAAFVSAIFSDRFPGVPPGGPGAALDPAHMRGQGPVAEPGSEDPSSGSVPGGHGDAPLAPPQ